MVNLNGYYVIYTVYMDTHNGHLYNELSTQIHFLQIKLR